MTARINVAAVRECLKSFDFERLFVEELGWNRPSIRTPRTISVGGTDYQYNGVAELAGVEVFAIQSPDGSVPTDKQRQVISKQIEHVRREHVLIFTDSGQTHTVWHWTKRENGKAHPRSHFYFKQQSGDAFIAKIAGMAVDLSERDDQGNVELVAVTKKVTAALDVQRVVKRFFEKYKDLKQEFTLAIQGIDDPGDRAWYASVILNRLKFIYFLQKAGFLDNGNRTYLETKLSEFPGQYFSTFLRPLFFDAFAKQPSDRRPDTARICGDIPYLNGGLFLPHRLEIRYEGKIDIPDSAFEAMFRLFGAYSWTFDDLPGNPDNEINPDVLGFIFEKYINQKEFGAYYTRTEITDYLCQQTVEQLVLDKMAAQGYKNHDSVGDLIIRLDARGLEILLKHVLPSISLLDPACGSGAFLFAALKTMLSLYTAALGRIDAVNSQDLRSWRARMFEGHRSLSYHLKKRIIVDNLYGVDLMEEAVEIAKLRLFMALISSVSKREDLEPLPNIDFNILPGNSLIGLMRVDDAALNETSESQIGLDLNSATYHEKVVTKNLLVHQYRHPHPHHDLAKIREEIDQLGASTKPLLNSILKTSFGKIRHQRPIWDTSSRKPGEPTKRALSMADIEKLEPFHWAFEFSERFAGPESGFDAILTNPPWEILKPYDKEFFLKYNVGVTKKKMSIKEFEATKTELLQADPQLREQYEDYLSQFPHQSEYFRTSPDFPHQSAVANGKKTGTDLNLYKLFTERCFALLQEGGLCGIVIPSGIYTDLGAKGLREMLFNKTQVTGLFGFENRRLVFEGVHRSFKFVLLSFRKGGRTVSFPARFMRHDVNELGDFPKSATQIVEVEKVKQLAPDTWSIMEVTSELDAQIADKMSEFPRLGEPVPDAWHLRLASEFHMTNDSHLFKTEPAPGRLPLYEGKMIWQFDSHYGKPRYWVDEQQGRAAILGRQNDIGQKIDPDFFRAGLRDIASTTNQRTLVSSMVPPCFHGNKIPTVKVLDPTGRIAISYREQLFLCAILNSFVIDFLIRKKVTNTLNFHYVYGLPIPRYSDQRPGFHNSNFEPLMVGSARLICTTPEFDDLAKEAGLCGFEEGVTDPNERAKLRAELDAIIAHLYGLTEEEFAHILNTFPLVPQAVKEATLEEFRRRD